MFDDAILHASFGGNSLLAEIGLGKASSIDRLEIIWPNKAGSRSVFTNVAVNKVVHITEGEEQLKVLPLKAIPFKKGAHEHHVH